MQHSFTTTLAFISLTLLLFTGCDEQFEKITPEVTWKKPDAIGVGVPLSKNQLNATADVAGTFTYSPEIGVVLEEGNDQQLNVVFTPKYATAFNEVNLSVLIDVIDKGTSSANFNESKNYGIMSDIDGNPYKTITIGDQVWMAENLRTTHYRNGDPITHVTNNAEWVNLSTEAYCSYSNTEDQDLLATHGLLYNWHAVSDLRNIAPEGWRVATQADWDKLIAELGGANNAGGRLKESGNVHWNSPSSGSNNSGFTALAGGRRQYTDGTFINLGFNGFWWANTPNGADFSFYYQINYDGNNIVAANFLRAAGYAVRCVKEN